MPIESKESKLALPFKAKGFNFTPEDVDIKSGIITGYAAKFGNIDSDSDMIMPGSFAESIVLRGPNGTNQIKHLLQHRKADIVGNCLTLMEDGYGLKFSTQATLGDTIADTTLLRYANKVYNEHSIGFYYEELEHIEATATMQPYWEVTKMFLMEYSTVTWGANGSTPFTGFKSLEDDGAKDWLERLCNDMSGLRSAVKEAKTDEVAALLEHDLRKVESELKEFAAMIGKGNPKQQKQISNQAPPFNALSYIQNHSK